MPWVLTQILDAHNHLMLAVNELESFLMAYGKQYTKDNLQRLVEYVAMCILRARDAVVFSGGVRPTPEAQPFRPLPRDVSIDLRVASDKILLVVMATPSAPVGLQPSQKGMPLVRGTMQDLLVPAEILETVEAEAAIPSLSETIAGMTAAYDLCYRLQDKLRMFPSHR